MSQSADRSAKVAEAKKKAEAQVAAAKRRTAVTWTVIAVIALGALAALIAFIVRQGDVEAPVPGAEGVPSVVSENGGFGVGPSGSVGEDLDASRVRLDVYFDFICPACGAFELSQKPMLDELRESGVVDIYYHPLAFLDETSNGTEYSTRAASAAALIAQESPDAFLPFLDGMMVNQPEEFTPGLSDEEIQAIATEAGVPADVVARIPDREFATWVRSASEHASKEGVRYTPTLSFNGQMQDPSLESSVQWGQEGALRQAILDLSAP